MAEVIDYLIDGLTIYEIYDDGTEQAIIRCETAEHAASTVKSLLERLVDSQED